MTKKPKWMRANFARNLDRPIENVPGRSPYLRDYGSIIHSVFFRRLSKKTQVYSSPNHDHVRTRLTHSVEVEQIGRQLARLFVLKLKEKKIRYYPEFPQEFEDLVAATSLAHDLGHAPFGHSGQKILHDLSYKQAKKESAVEYDDNKQVFHIFINEKLAPALSVSAPLCVATIKKISKACYKNESAILNEMLGHLDLGRCRHPASYLMEAADDIAYMASDLEDAFRLRVEKTDEYKHGFLGRLMALDALDAKGAKVSDLRRVFEKDESHAKKATFFLRALMSHALISLEEGLNQATTLDDLPEALDRHIRKRCSKELFNEKGELNYLFCSNESRDAAALLAVKGDLYGWILADSYIGQQDIVANQVICEIWECLSQLETCKDADKSSELKILPSDFKSRIIITRRDT